MESGDDVLTAPISPEQAAGLKPAVIPAAVYQAFNHFLILRSDGNGSIRIWQKELVDKVHSLMPDIEQKFPHRDWLNVEDTYRKLGWTVTFDRPGFNENYDSSWTFSPTRKGK